MFFLFYRGMIPLQKRDGGSRGITVRNGFSFLLPPKRYVAFCIALTPHGKGSLNPKLACFHTSVCRCLAPLSLQRCLVKRCWWCVCFSVKGYGGHFLSLRRRACAASAHIGEKDEPPKKQYPGLPGSFWFWLRRLSRLVSKDRSQLLPQNTRQHPDQHRWGERAIYSIIRILSRPVDICTKTCRMVCFLC